MATPAATGTPLIRVEQIHTFYGKSHVLHGVSLDVGRGEVVGLLGRNGVGKSTTLKSIMGLVRPTQGQILYEGQPVGGVPPHRLARIGIALATEPKLLCLDEPTAGMSVSETHATVDLIRRIARDLTIVIVEHDMEVVMGLAHTITVLNYGEVLAEGRPAEIQANARVQEVYLKT